MARLYPGEFVRGYTHEIGHILGDEFSFRNGDVLTPQEVKTAKLDISFHQKVRLLWELAVGVYPLPDGVSDFMVQVGNDLLSVFTRGKFDPATINLRRDMHKEEFNRLLREKVNNYQGGLNTFAPNEENDSFVIISSKEGRNDELPAIATEIGCQYILANTLSSLPFVNASYPRLKGLDPVFFQSSHGRAFRIISRAYGDKSRLKIPSLLDLRYINS